MGISAFQREIDKGDARRPLVVCLARLQRDKVPVIIKNFDRGTVGTLNKGVNDVEEPSLTANCFQTRFQIQWQMYAAARSREVGGKGL